MIISYVRRRLQRNPAQVLILVVLGGVFAVLLLRLNSYLTVQLDNRQEFLPNIAIRCVVTDSRGEKSEGLAIPSYVVDYFVSEDSPLLQFADNVAIKSVFSFEIPHLGRHPQMLEVLKLNERNMVALTRLEAERRLDPVHGVQITLLPGNNEDSFQETSRYICLLPKDLYDLIINRGEEESEAGLSSPENEQGKILEVNLFLRDSSGLVAVGYDMHIAGYYQGGIGDIYCNWQVAKDGFFQTGEPYRAESLSFILRDNHRLEEFKKVSNAHIDGSGPHIPGVIDRVSLKIHDQQFNTVRFSLERNIKMLQLLIPLLNFLAIAIGFWVSYIFIRNRKHEFSLMACLGTAKPKVFLLVFVEMALLMFTGISLGTVFYMVAVSLTIDIYITLVLFLCFMLGASAAIVRILLTNVLSLLSKE